MVGHGGHVLEVAHDVLGGVDHPRALPMEVVLVHQQPTHGKPGEEPLHDRVDQRLVLDDVHREHPERRAVGPGLLQVSPMQVDQIGVRPGVLPPDREEVVVVVERVVPQPQTGGLVVLEEVVDLEPRLVPDAGPAQRLPEQPGCAAQVAAELGDAGVARGHHPDQLVERRAFTRAQHRAVRLEQPIHQVRVLVGRRTTRLRLCRFIEGLPADAPSDSRHRRAVQST